MRLNNEKEKFPTYTHRVSALCSRKTVERRNLVFVDFKQQLLILISGVRSGEDATTRKQRSAYSKRSERVSCQYCHKHSYVPQ